MVQTNPILGQGVTAQPHAAQSLSLPPFDVLFVVMHRVDFPSDRPKTFFPFIIIASDAIGR